VFAEHRNEIEAVIADVSMPYMDGPSMLRAMKRMDPDLKPIVMSGLMNDSQRGEIEGLEIKDGLSKPFTADTLLETLASCLRSGS
jgi:DNA-binding NtrC family response regulator